MSIKERHVSKPQKRNNQMPESVPAASQSDNNVTDTLLKAVALQQAGEIETAEILYKNVLETDPNHFVALNLLGTIYVQNDNAEDAIALMQKATQINPHYAEAHYIHGLALYNVKRYNDALASYDKAIAIDPTHFNAHHNHGIVLYHLKRYNEALASYDKAIAVKPDFAEAYTNRGNLLAYQKRYDEALASYDKAITVRPDYGSAYYHKSLIKLLCGAYEEGWRLHEWRWKTEKLIAEAQTHPKPLWLGKESLAGKTLLVASEQGIGDIIQFSRYIPLLKTLGADVIIGVPSPLTEIFSTLKGSYRIFGEGTYTFDYDYYCPIMSLPLAFGTTLETIPSEPYLFPQPEYVEKWRTILNDRMGTQGLKIGLCWAGGQRPDDPDCVRTDGRRSLHFSQLKPLLEVPHTGFVSLQLGPPKDQLDDTRVADISGGLQNWSDTAAVVSMLDLVITVDTSVCHLAGAMGKKTWLLNRYDTCWRWLLDRDDSPWYPSLTQFRQTTPGNWDEVIASVKAELEAL